MTESTKPPTRRTFAARVQDWAVTMTMFVLCACAVILTMTLVRRQTEAARATTDGPTSIVDWQKYTERGAIIGREHAPITIIEFSDFQCPFCGALQADLRSVLKAYPDSVRLVYRHFPLEQIHPFARAAAVASECAGAQGQFRAFHDALYEHQDSIGVRTFEQFAEIAGVPRIEAFKACLESEAPKAAVAEDIKAGMALGLRGTPMLIINGTIVRGRTSAEVLQQHVRDATSRLDGNKGA